MLLLSTLRLHHANSLTLPDVVLPPAALGTGNDAGSLHILPADSGKINLSQTPPEPKPSQMYLCYNGIRVCMQMSTSALRQMALTITLPTP